MFESLPVSITPSRAFCRLSSGKFIAVLSHTLNLCHRFLVTGHHTNRRMRVSSFSLQTLHSDVSTRPILQSFLFNYRKLFNILY